MNPNNGHFYALTSVLSWKEAEDYAVKLGGHLVSIGDAEELNWVVDKFGGDKPFWIGLNDLEHEGSWAWTSGEPVTIYNWATGKPDDKVPTGWIRNPANGHYYALTPLLFWDEASAYARAHGAHLVSITSSAEQE